MAQTHIFRGVETTTLRNHDGALVGIYRGTEVASQLGNIITLKTGGWKSRTTKLRMNQFANTYAQSRFGVMQKDFDWFVIVGDQKIPCVGDSITFEV
jgi:hypothetical protein